LCDISIIDAEPGRTARVVGQSYKRNLKFIERSKRAEKEARRIGEED
jgi:hypothetical protein